MKHFLTSIIAAAVLTSTAPALPAFAATEVVSAQNGPVVVEARRNTCWRTNRSTGQKFRIC
jgi:hypothetical protein